MAVVVLMVGGLAGCGASELGADTSTKRGGVRYSIKSKGTKFNIDNVTLDLYYGHNYTNPTSTFQYNYEKHELVSFALYFCDGQYYQSNYEFELPFFYTTPRVYSDYTDVEGHYLVKELSLDEFSSGEYYVKFNPIFGYKFNHRETITVPRGVFERESGSFVFKVAGVFSLKDDGGEDYGDGGYIVLNSNCIYVRYDYVDEQTILLSKPSGAIPY
jgi:hypothetical protein